MIRVLDLCCRAGGAAMGIHRALEAAHVDHEIVGVDVEDMDGIYPFTFVRADAFAIALRGFDFIWASPPCQRYASSGYATRSNHRHPDLIPQMREFLESSGAPWVMENVVPAPLRTSIILCGTMFGLRTFRHRAFESSQLLFQPAHIGHAKQGLRYVRQGYAPKLPNEVFCIVGSFPQRELGARVLGVEWMKRRKDIAECVPPVYAEFIARQIFGLPALPVSSRPGVIFDSEYQCATGVK